MEGCANGGCSITVTSMATATAWGSAQYTGPNVSQFDDVYFRITKTGTLSGSTTATISFAYSIDGVNWTTLRTDQSVNNAGGGSTWWWNNVGAAVMPTQWYWFGDAENSSTSYHTLLSWNAQ
jgi:hypothetical protein